MHYSVFVRFLVNGGLATALHYAVFLYLIQNGTSGLMASSIGAVIGLIGNYFLQYHLTFAAFVSHRKAFPSFMLVGLFSCGANALLFYLFQFLIHGHDWLIQLIVTGVLTVFNFVLYKKVFSYDALSI